MSRNIKFRFWNKESKAYEYDLAVSNNLVVGIYDYDWSDKGKHNENYIVEQFTGLYDARGKEIYEGDLLLYKLSYEESMGGQLSDEISEVYFNSGAFWMKDADTLFNYLGSTNNQLEGLQVCGNIHENPDTIHA